MQLKKYLKIVEIKHMSTYIIYYYLTINKFVSIDCIFITYYFRVIGDMIKFKKIKFESKINLY